MASNAERVALLVRALEASLTGDSSVVKDLYTDDVCGWWPSLEVSSAVELAVELEDREPMFGDVELDVHPLDVGEDRACIEWTATVTRSHPPVVGDERTIEDAGPRCHLHGVTVAEFDGDRIRAFRQYCDEADVLAQLGLPPDD